VEAVEDNDTDSLDVRELDSDCDAVTDVVGVTLEVKDLVQLREGVRLVDGVTDAVGLSDTVGVSDGVSDAEGVAESEPHRCAACCVTIHWPMPPSLTGNTPSLSHNTSLTYHSLDVPTSTPCHPASQ
jgi:hypothetical protein